MPEINFFLTHKKVEGRVIKKPRPVYAFVYHSPGKRTAYPTGLTILEKHWDKKRQRAKSKAPGANAINRRLNEWHDNILNILSDLNIELAGRPVHERKAYLKRRLNILSGREIPVSLALTGFINTYCKERADMLKKAGRGGHSAYTALAFRWGEYLKENYSSNRTSLPEFSDLNRTLLSNFAKWLLEQHPKRSNGKGQGYTFDTSKTLSRTSVEQILIKMKRVVRVAVDRELDAGRELHINKAFARASAKDVLDDIGAAYAPIKEGVYLTFGEIRQLYEFDLSGWAEGYRSIRDAFVAACLHGLRKHAWEQVSTKAIQFELDGVSFQLVNLHGRDNSK